MLILLQRAIRQVATTEDFLLGLQQNEIIYLTRALNFSQFDTLQQTSAAILGNNNRISISAGETLFDEFSGSIQDLTLDIHVGSVQTTLFALTMHDAHFWNVNVTIYGNQPGRLACYAQYVNFSAFDAFFLTYASQDNAMFAQFSIIQSQFQFSKIDGKLAAQISRSVVVESVFDSLPAGDKLGQVSFAGSFCVQAHENCSKIATNVTLSQQEMGASIQTNYTFKVGLVFAVFQVRRKACDDQLLVGAECITETCGVMQQQLCSGHGICDEFKCVCDAGFGGSQQCAANPDPPSNLFLILFIVVVVLLVAAVVAFVVLFVLGNKKKAKMRGNNRLVELSEPKGYVFSEVVRPSGEVTPTNDNTEPSLLGSHETENEPAGEPLRKLDAAPAIPKPLTVSVQQRSLKKAAQLLQ